MPVLLERLFQTQLFLLFSMIYNNTRRATYDRVYSSPVGIAEGCKRVFLGHYPRETDPGE